MDLLVPWRVWHLRIMQWLGIWKKPEPHSPYIEERNYKHVMRVLKSCETRQQLENAMKWAIRVLEEDRHIRAICDWFRIVPPEETSS